MKPPRYLLTPAGVRLEDATGHLHDPLRQPLTLLYDRVEGEVLKHGEKSKVEASARRLAEALGGTTLPADLATLEIPAGGLTPAVLDLVNLAITERGNVGELLQLFGGLDTPGGGNT